MDYAKESLRLHYEWKGKLEMTPRAAVDSKESLALAYTPGVGPWPWPIPPVWPSPAWRSRRISPRAMS